MEWNYIELHEMKTKPEYPWKKIVILATNLRKSYILSV